VRRIVATCAWGAGCAVAAIAAGMVLAVLGLIDGIARTVRWVELHAVYHGDAEAQDRARWKAS